MKKAFFWIFAFLIIFGIFAWNGFRYAINIQSNLSGPSNIILNNGDGVKRIAWKLYKKNIIISPYLFEIVVKYYNLEKKMKAGEYIFQPNITILDVVNKIAKGDIVFHKITLPEGLTNKQIFDIINDSDLQGNISIILDEGKILPETYSYKLNDTKDSLIKQATEAMAHFIDKQWETRDKNIPIKNKQELLTLASIVEKETGVAEERKVIASVFINRLRKGIKLQTDPTVIYAITKGQFNLERALTRKDLAFKDEYNTYLHYGLPPAPICNPSKEAILAVLHPDNTDYLYFVANGEKGHNFSKNLTEHNKNIQKYKQKIKQNRYFSKKK